MQQKYVILLVVIGFVGFIWGAFAFGRGLRGGTDDVGTDDSVATSGVREENGVQVIQITARGGYSPRQVTAQAGKPARLEIETNGTYDCSTSLTIPALGFQKQLPATGVTKVDVPAQTAGKTVRGVCSMGMYSFTIQFD